MRAAGDGDGDSISVDRPSGWDLRHELAATGILAPVLEHPRDEREAGYA